MSPSGYIIDLTRDNYREAKTTTGNERIDGYSHSLAVAVGLLHMHEQLILMDQSVLSRGLAISSTTRLSK